MTTGHQLDGEPEQELPEASKEHSQVFHEFSSCCFLQCHRPLSSIYVYFHFFLPREILQIYFNSFFNFFFLNSFLDYFALRVAVTPLCGRKDSILFGFISVMGIMGCDTVTQISPKNKSPDCCVQVVEPTKRRRATPAELKSRADREPSVVRSSYCERASELTGASPLLRAYSRGDL